MCSESFTDFRGAASHAACRPHGGDPAFARRKGWAGCLDLLHGTFDLATTLDFDFTVSHITCDLASVAHDQHAFASDGFVQLTFDVDEVSFRGTCDHARSADQHILGDQVTFDRARDDGLVGALIEPLNTTPVPMKMLLSLVPSLMVESFRK